MLVLAIVALGIPLDSSLRARVNAEVRTQALGQASLVAATSADLVVPPRVRALEALASSSAAAVHGRVIIVDSHGRVLADSARGTIGSDYGSRPEIATALSGRTVQLQRYSKSLDQEILATAVPVLHDGRTRGAVRITQSVAAVQRALDSTTAKLALVAGLVLLLGLLAGAVIARQIANPIGRLKGAADRIAGGDLDARTTVEGSSEQRALARAFNQMADRVQELIAAQRRFVADASHQLRTPLAAVRLRMEEARTESDNPTVTQDLDAGMAEIDRLAATIQELLLLGRAEAAGSPVETVDLAGAASSAVERWTPAARARGSTIELEVDSPGVVHAATRDIDGALDVFVENALNYAPDGTTVTVRAGRDRVEVLDRGPGLGPGETGESLFERFRRGQAASATGAAGSGLGLAIARSLAHAWGGEALLADRPGGGAVATLTFPGKELL